MRDVFNLGPTVIGPGPTPVSPDAVDRFRRALNGRTGVVRLSEESAKDALCMLRDAGFTITFPERPFYVEPGPRSHHHIVYRRADGPTPVAEFYGYANALDHACYLADRLNREAEVAQ